MLRTSNELVRYDVEASDGKIGVVTDLLFDAGSWKIQSIVVDTGGFLHHHRVLVDPAHLRDLKFPDETFVLDLSKAEVQASHSLEAPQAASRQQSGLGSPTTSEQVNAASRSCNAAQEYTVAAQDAMMGRLHGLIIETSTWTIRYLIVDTGEWLMGKLVLIGPQAIERLDDARRTIEVNVTADAIRHSPPYDETAELSRDYEAFLHDHYDWPPYWCPHTHRPE